MKNPGKILTIGGGIVPFKRLCFVIIGFITICSCNNNSNKNYEYFPGITSNKIVYTFDDGDFFTFTENKTDDGIMYFGNAGNLLSAYKYSIIVDSTNDSRIKSIEAAIIYSEYNFDAKETMEEFLRVFTEIPYKGADPELAQKWLSENIHTHGAKTNINGIWFSISRLRGARILQLTTKEPEIELLDEIKLKEIEEEDAVLNNADEEIEETIDSTAGKIRIDIIDVDRRVSEDEISEQPEGYIYFSLKVRMINNTDNKIDLGSNWMFFANDMHIYGTDEKSYNLKKPALEGIIESGGTQEGWITFKTRLNYGASLSFTGELRPLFIKD